MGTEWVPPGGCTLELSSDGLILLPITEAGFPAHMCASLILGPSPPSLIPGERRGDPDVYVRKQIYRPLLGILLGTPATQG